MKIKRETEVAICDVCEEADAPFSSCNGCHKDICYECRKSHAVEYSHAVYFSGTGDGMYCHSCDEVLHDDPLHKAYAEVAALKQESIDFQEDFRRRSDEAEAALKTLQQK